jgi:hypothetical protein
MFDHAAHRRAPAHYQFVMKRTPLRKPPSSIDSFCKDKLGGRCGFAH